jgi:hypothetical protein
MLVEALEPCFVAGSRRRQGDVFECKEGGKLPSYLKPVNPASVETQQPDDTNGLQVVDENLPEQAPPVPEETPKPGRPRRVFR